MKSQIHSHVLNPSRHGIKRKEVMRTEGIKLNRNVNGIKGLEPNKKKSKGLRESFKSLSDRHLGILLSLNMPLREDRDFIENELRKRHKGKLIIEL